MRNRTLLLCILLYALQYTVSATDRDSVLFRNAQSPAISLSSERGELGDYLQYGVRIGTDINLSSKWISDLDYQKRHLSAQFGFYVRGGYRFIFAETGLEYTFHKCFYETWTPDGLPIASETVESRYLQIPLKAVGLIKAGNICAFLPYAGIIYKPLIHCSKNDINYGKATLTRHQCQFTAGLELRIKFVTIGAGYQYNLMPFFSDRKSVRQQFLSINLGVQL